jgi:hypothetical protein
MSTDIEAPSKSALPAEVDESLLAAQGLAQIDDEDLVLPVIQLTQQLSRAVTDGKVPSGHFYDATAGKDYGENLEFIIVAYAKGRFYVHNRDKDDERTFVASGRVAPDTWPEPYAGQTFADISDAEEQWKARANAGEIEWGKGPPIVTTHNFVGFPVGEEGSAARLGLSRTSAPTARKILTAMRMSQRPQWASTFVLSTKVREKGGKPFFVVQAEQGRQTTPEEVEAAKVLAYQIQQAGQFALTGDEVEEADKAAQAKPKAPAGGVSV